MREFTCTDLIAELNGKNIEIISRTIKYQRINQRNDSSRAKKKKQRARREQIISGVRAFSLPNGAGAEVSLEGIPTNRSETSRRTDQLFPPILYNEANGFAQKPPAIRLRKGGLRLLLGQALRLLPRYTLHDGDGTVRWHGRVPLYIVVQTVMHERSETRLPVAARRLATI